MRGCKKAVICIVAAVLLVSTAVFAAILSYPNAQVLFSGIQVKVNPSTNTVQGFVDITLKDINTTGVTFCLQYDTDYLEVSSVDKNEKLIANDILYGKYNTSHAFFDQNTEIFPAGIFQDQALLCYTALGCADPVNGYISMSFNPTFAVDKYVEETENEFNMLLADVVDGLKFGSISFNIKNPTEFSKLSKEELKGLLKVVNFTDMYGTRAPNMDYGVSVSYLDENGITAHDQTVKIGYGFEINSSIEKVEAQKKDYTVTAYDLYQGNGINDLYDFLNEKASVLVCTLSTGDKVPVKVEWNSSNTTVYDKNGYIIPYNKPWDPKGSKDAYRVTMRYSPGVTITINVTVLPVTLTGFAVENQTLTYVAGTPDFPSIPANLRLPDKARPLLDTVILNGGIPEVGVSSYKYNGSDLNSLPDDFGDVTKSYKFTGKVNIDSIQSSNPWLTVGSSVKDSIDAVRNVISEEDAGDYEPFVISATANTDDDGTLTINVSAVSGGTIDQIKGFEIRLPDGELIDITTPADGVTYAYDNAGKITLKADISLAEKLAKAINLGERLGAFSIVAVRDWKGIDDKSAAVPVSSNPRLNIYTDPGVSVDWYDVDEKTYIFDYSLEYSAMFPVDSDGNLSTTITLPIASHWVGSTYDGYDGGEPGRLTTITVNEWKDITDTSSSDTPDRLQRTKTVEGTLKTTEYTNYGTVTNRDEIKVRITYYTVEQEEDSISINPKSFTYNKQRVGYDYDKLQTATFTVSNNGSVDVYGLSAVISLANGKEAFIVTKELPLILKQGEVATLDISNKYGLPVGKYTATVTIYSNNKALGTITLNFEVTDKEVYTITLTVNDPDFGTAETYDGTTTACADDQVTIIATPNNDETYTDYVFVEWESDDLEDVVEAPLDLTKSTVTFTMPEHDVAAEARFEETLGAKLRPSKLYVMPSDVDLNEDADNYLPFSDSDWQTISFDPATHEYYMIVDNEIDLIDLWFLLTTDEAAKADKTVTNTVKDEQGNVINRYDKDKEPIANPMTGTIYPPDTPPDNESDTYYTTSAFSLEIGPNKNVIELTFKYNDPEDDPDEGLVERTYTINIYRKVLGEYDDISGLAKFHYGNSPYGRIMRDETLTSDQDKEDAKKDFVDNGYRFAAGFAPDGTVANFTYAEDAWKGTGVNYDLNDYALFLVSTRNQLETNVFYDPGYAELTNSIGQKISDDITPKKSITINILRNNSGLGNESDFTDIVEKTIEFTDDDLSALFNDRIRPDVYELKYTYEDYDGSSITIKKPLIFLYPLGDVNISGTATAADATRIRQRYRSNRDIAGNGLDDYSAYNVFRHRIVDVSGDGYVNMLDCNAIYKLISGTGSESLRKNIYENITEKMTTP